MYPFSVTGPVRPDDRHSPPVHTHPPTRYDPTGVTPVIKPNGVAAGPAAGEMPALPLFSISPVK
jgi:hypothetical protein